MNKQLTECEKILVSYASVKDSKPDCTGSLRNATTKELRNGLRI